MIRISWDVEEIVAFIDLYERTKIDCLDVDTELRHFSAVLIKRAKTLGIDHDDVYRNFNVVIVRDPGDLSYPVLLFEVPEELFHKFRFPDAADTGHHGLPGASKAFVEVYQMRNKCPYVFEMILHEFNRKYCSSPSK